MNSTSNRGKRPLDGANDYAPKIKIRRIGLVHPDSDTRRQHFTQVICSPTIVPTISPVVNNREVFLRSKRDRLLTSFNDWYGDNTNAFAPLKATFCDPLCTENNIQLTACYSNARLLFNEVVAEYYDEYYERDVSDNQIIEAMVTKVESLREERNSHRFKDQNQVQILNHTNFLCLCAYTRAIEVLEAHLKYLDNVTE